MRETGGQQGTLQGTQDGRELEPRLPTRDGAVQQMAVTGCDSRTGPRRSGPWAGPLWGQDGPGKGGSWVDVEGEEPFCRGCAVVHSHVCHQAE